MQLQGTAREPDARESIRLPTGKRKSSRMRGQLQRPVALDAVARTLDAHHRARWAGGAGARPRRRRRPPTRPGPAPAAAGRSSPEMASHRSPNSGWAACRRARCGSGRSARPSCRPRAARRCAGCRGAATTPSGVGLCSMVRASSSSKLSKLAGPLTKLVIGAAFSALTPGVMSTSTRARTSSGAWAASAMEDTPPSDIPTTPRASGASSADDRRQVAAVAAGRERALGPAVGVAVAGQVDRQQRPAQGQGHGVPGVGVLGPAVDEHELGRPGRPRAGWRRCGPAPPRRRPGARRAARRRAGRTRRRSRGTARTRRRGSSSGTSTSVPYARRAARRAKNAPDARTPALRRRPGRRGGDADALGAPQAPAPPVRAPDDPPRPRRHGRDRRRTGSSSSWGTGPSG